MSFFDKILDSFSSRDLGKRVRYVILFGLVVLAIAIAGGYKLLTKEQTISIDGVMSLARTEKDIIRISIPHDQISRLPQSGRIEIEFMVPKLKGRRFETGVAMVKPGRGIVGITKPDGIEGKIPEGRLDVKLIVTDAPLWRLLTNKN